MMTTCYSAIVITMVLLSFSCQTSKSESSIPFSQFFIHQLAGGILQQSAISYRFGKSRSTRNDAYITLYDSKTQFKSYYPEIFQSLRKSAGIDEKEFLQSLCVENMDCLTNTDSKSGQLFWKSKDGKLLIKTIKHYECKTLRRILPALKAHVLDNQIELPADYTPNQRVPASSMLNNLLGLYRIRFPKSRMTKYCLICKNIYPEAVTLSSGYTQSHEQYDLKGSLVGRKKNPQSMVYKDLDFLQQQHPFQLGEVNKACFLTQLERDSAFLRSQGLMDYSLLVYVERLLPHHIPSSPAETPLPLPPIPIPSLPSMETTAVATTKTTAEVVTDREEWNEFISRRLCLLPVTNIGSLILSHAPSDRGKMVFLGRDNQLYHFGLVDFLQEYSCRKRCETWLKSLIWNWKLVSCVPPRFYAQRMVTFFRQYTE